MQKAEGLTVAADWTRQDGSRAGGAVLVHGAGMDEASLTVATTRHRDRMWLFAAREALETAEDTWQRGVPTEEAERTARVIGALGAHAAATAADANDNPVHDDLGRAARWPSPDEAGRRLEQLLEHDHQADLEQLVAHETPRRASTRRSRRAMRACNRSRSRSRSSAPADTQTAGPSGQLAQPRDRWVANAALRAAARRQLDEADHAGGSPDPAEHPAIE